ncbi:tetratricopeptide repeat protein [Plebeiibacterium sediminum]|uniref:Tetratricopeptide repeat protein n=1 Tax=Plebeiibacterium sediminum TaxID=2992112 RepID=A0AAE3SFR0_9BACT|nr:tetratricopeptide repeat protein [Plebeiobacterium sediminum]MCW3787708.1 tetratricopeptide repeat protein [Plebeiobacterium sediminum]
MKWVGVIILFLIGMNIQSQKSYVVDMDNRNLALDLMDKAQTYLEDKRCEEALTSLVKALSVDSVLRETYLMIYKVWLSDKSNKDTVVRALEKGKRIFSDDDELCFYLAEIFKDSSELPEAILEYTNATNYAKRNGEDFYLVHYYYFNRANCFMQMKMYDGALQDYNYTIKLKPEFAAAFYNRGVCLYMKGKKEDACIDWQQALDMGYEASKQNLDKYCNKK